jgi:erythronate-4-phosphate dehydrogenase
MKIICATNMPYVEEAFSTLGQAVVLEGRRISPADVRDADILALRSTTVVDRAMLEGSRVKFVGTATIGTDHLDIPYMEKAGIHWCFAPGCNANSVSEYITAALLVLSRRGGYTLEGLTLGVVGVGNVGSRVVRKAEALGLRVLKNDPPVQRKNGDKSFASIGQIQEEADIITFHVPLTREGPDATFHMADDSFFKGLRKPVILLDAARGPVIDTPALVRALDAGRVKQVVLDTWEGEPKFDRALLDRVDLGTPHIAGHSFEGKVAGTMMVYEDACRWLGVKPTFSPESLLPPALVPDLAVQAAGRADEDVLRDVVKPVYDIEADDARMRAIPGGDAARLATEFDRQRKDYPMRREFRYTRLHVSGGSSRLIGKLKGLGFQVSGPGA